MMGTRARIAAVTSEHCQPESAFIRAAVLEHLKRAEAEKGEAERRWTRAD